MKDHNDFIRKYLDRSATEADLIQMRDLAATDTAFAEELESARLALKVQDKIGEAKTKEAIASAWKTKFEEKKTAKTYRMYKFLAAASLTGILLTTGIIYWRQSEKTPLNLTASAPQLAATEDQVAASAPTPNNVEDLKSIQNTSQELSQEKQATQNAREKSAYVIEKIEKQINMIEQALSKRQLLAIASAPTYQQTAGYFAESVTLRSAETKELPSSEHLLLSKALRSYENKNYKEVITTLRDYQGPIAHKVAYLESLSYLQVHDYAKARNAASKIASSVIFETEAEWVILLADYAEGKDVSAELQSIKDDAEHTYAKEAQKLLEGK
jgi:hypothetical protein